MVFEPIKFYYKPTNNTFVNIIQGYQIFFNIIILNNVLKFHGKYLFAFNIPQENKAFKLH